MIEGLITLLAIIGIISLGLVAWLLYDLKVWAVEEGCPPNPSLKEALHWLTSKGVI